ncbi:MAG: DHH family phosphoesterase [Patescibacteria group bacterium]|nr:DHH family phosphoesterase [Patescibacteria group bacterium]
MNETQQIIQEIKKSHHLLITFRKDFSVDAVASAVALYLVLKKQGKIVDIACDNIEMPKNLSFLPKIEHINKKIDNIQKFIISVDVANDKIDEFSYNIEGDQLKIYITPKAGSFKKEDVKTQNSKYRYDLIITLDTPDLESLGKIFKDFTDFFYSTTIINIDHNPENEYYGQINLTNLNAVATAEVLFQLINDIDQNILDKDIATCLLTGLIAKTRSFKTPNVTPKTLAIAGQLMAKGAENETIIKSLYRSRSLTTLNLWGRVLARLKSRDNNKLVWSLLTEHDFVEAQAQVRDLPDVIEELISFIPGVEIVVLIYQFQGQTKVLINTFKSHNAMYLASQFKPTGSKHLAEFQLEGLTLLDAEKEIIENLKTKLGQK